MQQPWPQLCLFGDQGPDGAEADNGTWCDKVRRCKCTRCELIQLSMQQMKETGRLDGVMSRVRDLERENDHLKREHIEMKLRLVVLERTSRELQTLAENFRQSYKSKKTHKRKIVQEMEFANHVPPKNSDPAGDRHHPPDWAVRESHHGLDGVTGVPGVPA
jgi:hypothetical protein